MLVNSFEYGEKVYVIHRSGFAKEIKFIKECKFISMVMHNGHYFSVIDNFKRILTFENNDVFRTKEDALESAIRELSYNKEYHDKSSERCTEVLNSLKAEFAEKK